MKSLIKNEDFDNFFKTALGKTCNQWDYRVPGDEYFEEVYRRLPYGLQSIIIEGMRSGIIINSGLSKRGSAAFNLNGHSNGKGPYAWFEQETIKRQPRPCWEYFIQVGEYVRLVKAIGNGDKFKIKFEDHLMDIALYRGDHLFVCCEIKKESAEADKLLNSLKDYSEMIDLPDYDRGNDGLRKAKYLRMMKPEFFYIASIGRRYEFRVDYHESDTFCLIEDMIPF